MHTEYPPIVTKMVMGLTATAQTYYVPQSEYWVTPAQIGHESATPCYVDGGTGARGGKLALVGTGTEEYGAVIHGYLPWSTMDFKLGDLDDMEDWYDPAGKGKVEMRILSHSGGTSGACAVVLEQLRRY
jgi:hypothetical protein